MSEQLHLFGVIDPPPWPYCFGSCSHFGGPDDDYFPGTRTKRCMYGISQCGTSGADQYIRKTANGFTEFFCKFYDPK